MHAERWKQIDKLFHAALERDAGERAAFLTQVCVGDERLRQEVESLLASHDQAASFIEVPAGDAAAELLAEHDARLRWGTMLNRYRILDLLGKGGMGEVYLAEDTRLSRKIAVKLLPPQFTISSERVHRFEHEARAVSALNHPNIVTIHEIGRLNGTNFIVTEFVDGQTLRQVMSGTWIHLSEALELSIQIADALDAAHTAGIVHRDIKPENIMVRRDGYVKVLDFGLAKLAGRDAAIISTEALPKELVDTNPGLVMGTVAYMSPEQALGGDVDVRTDIWSLGIVLFEMLTGRTPFASGTPNHVIVSILEKEPPSLTRFAENVPAELERIVTKALRRNKDERYQTVKDLALDLKALKQELDVEARLERYLPASSSGSAMQRSTQAIVGAGRTTASQATALPTSSAEYIVNEIKRHKRGAIFGAATTILLIAAIGYVSYFGAGGGEAIDSVAVLPFINVNNDADTEYLSDGLSDSIINNLSQLPSLKKVSAFNSVLLYKGKQTDPQVVGRELGVRAVLMGRLIEHGDDLSISVELMDVRDNKRLWGEQYNRKLSDLPALQIEISREISEKLRLRLTSEERKQLAKRYTENLEAYEAYLQGRYYTLKRTAPALRKAIEYFEQAIKADPSYALAYAGLARAYYTPRENMVQLPEEARQKTESALQKALELDGNLSEAHALLGAIKQDQDDWPSAEKQLKRAIDLNPNGWGVRWYYSKYLAAIGRHDEAIAESKRMLENDPLSPTSFAAVAWQYLNARQYDQAIELFQKALETEPEHAPFHTNLARAYVQKRMYREAIAEFQTAMAIDSSPPGRFAAFAYTYAVSGNKAEAVKMLSELKKRAKQSYVAPVNFAIIYAGLGENDRAFEWLEKAYKDRTGPPYLTFDLMLNSLRSDPKFADFALRKGLAP